ncbi:hypothetical protein BCR39DRAFT_543695 [Naematelia encephala]|uniref:Uncharacterized protein n=1 Tax=Naematelia encephala TaxID=71784 RepID=A0A1Y2ATN5_9TREE|nr:hypothetical protein BCR39DRAFT_543695 [Naematelia encephala]
MRLTLAVVLWTALLAYQVEAHQALWNYGLFGYNWPYQASNKTQDWNSNAVVSPLRKTQNLTIAEWFGRGMTKYPPRTGEFMSLPSGGIYQGEIACNRAYTKLMQQPSLNGSNLTPFACEGGTMHQINPLVTSPPPNNTWLGGTALAIAYTSDVDTLKPSDMVIISVNFTSVFWREIDYSIPKGLPPCPDGGCLCTWNWYHLAGHGEGYGQEMYNTLYRCNVTGETDSSVSLALGAGTVPVYCGNDTSSCVTGPKTPMYAWMAEGSNMPDSPIPRYSAGFGFSDGAQTDVLSVAKPSVNSAARRRSTNPSIFRFLGTILRPSDHRTRTTNGMRMRRRIGL